MPPESGPQVKACIEGEVGSFSSSGRIVANPDKTPSSSSVRIDGDPDGTPEFAFQALDSRLGDLAKPEFLPATWALSGVIETLS